MKSVKITGKKVATLGDAGRLYIVLPEIGRTFIPKEHGLKEGETLSGTCVCEEKTYDMEADGVTKRATPLKRWELVDYTSFRSQAEAAQSSLAIAIIESKAAAVATMAWSAKDFSFSKEEIGAA